MRFFGMGLSGVFGVYSVALAAIQSTLAPGEKAVFCFSRIAANMNVKTSSEVVKCTPLVLNETIARRLGALVSEYAESKEMQLREVDRDFLLVWGQLFQLYGEALTARLVLFAYPDGLAELDRSLSA
jgi:hypothetical protein